jgi:hypothetical protein
MEENLTTYQVLKDTPKILPLIYKDCLQPSAKKVGQALETVLEISNTILLPIKLLNEKAKVNFKKHMETYREKLDKVQNDKIIDIPPIIGTPIIDRLTYVTNDEIAELFINLLTNASSEETINKAHPAFIHMIDRMTIDEARIINHLSDKEFIPYINIISRNQQNHEEFITLAWNLTGLEFDIELMCKDNIDTYLDNLSSLNIIHPQKDLYKTMPNIYEQLKDKYSDLINEVEKHISKDNNYSSYEITKSFYEITDLGSSFIRACSNNHSK